MIVASAAAKMIGPSLLGISGGIVDDLLQCIAGRREHRRHAQRDHREIDRAPDRDLGVVQAIAKQRDEEAELEE